MYLLYNTTLNVSLQLMQLTPSRNTENPVDAAMAEAGAGLKMSTRSRVKTMTQTAKKRNNSIIIV